MMSVVQHIRVSIVPPVLRNIWLGSKISTPISYSTRIYTRRIVLIVERYLRPDLLADLREKMVFLGGPRQVGKTTLALSLFPADRILRVDAACVKHYCFTI